jgi:hypothetical protein
MAKLTLSDVTGFENQNSASGTINANSAATEAALENTLSRTGATPNQMEANLDMNSHHILNLPAPTGVDEPLRVQELTDFLNPSGQVNVINLSSPDYINVRDFGATGNGTTDDTAAIQAAINATPYGGKLYIPAGRYKLIGSGSQCLLRTTPIHIFGDGQSSTVLAADSSVPNTRDWLVFNFTATGLGWSVRNLCFGDGSSLFGRHHLRFIATGAVFAYNILIADNFFVENPNGNSIQFDNGSVAYAQIIRNNMCSIQMFNVGDNIAIQDNLITSVNAVTARYGIYLTGVAGAADVRIIGNVLATRNGMILVDAATGVIIRDNEFETPVGLVNPDGFVVYLRGAVSPIMNPIMVKNQYSVLSGTGDPIPLRIGDCDNAIVDEARIFNSAGVHMVIDATANNTYVSPWITCATGVAFPLQVQVTNGGANTRMGTRNFFGTGNPNGVHQGFVGDLFSRTDGSANNRLYMNTNGVSAWAAMTSA